MKKTTSILAILLLGFSVVLSSCKKEEVTPTPATTPTPSTPGGTGSNYFISYSENGNAVSQVNGTSGYSVSVSTGAGVDAPNDYINMSSGASMYYWNMSGGNDNYSGIDFENNVFSLNTYSSDKPAALASIFSLGTHSFASSVSNNAGVSFSILDSNGDSWTTTDVTQPSNATFTVTESTAAIISNEYVRKVKGTFNNLTVTNGSGTTKAITNGSFYLYFEAY